MNDYEFQLTLQSRRNLDTARNTLTYFRDRHPVIYSQLYEAYLTLEQRQQVLEAMVAPEQAEKFGLVLMAAIIGGTLAVVGATGFLFGKQREETQEYKAYLECLQTMTSNFEADGLGSVAAAERAVLACKGQVGAPGILQKIRESTAAFFKTVGGAADIMPILLLGGAAFAIWWYFFRK